MTAPTRPAFLTRMDGEEEQLRTRIEGLMLFLANDPARYVPDPADIHLLETQLYAMKAYHRTLLTRIQRAEAKL